MSLLFKYLKKHYWSLIIIVSFLYALAMCDLALPEYMAKIVNNGIVRSGIEETVAEVLIEEDYQNLYLVIDQDTKDNIEKIYTLITPDQASDKQIKKYPVLERENIYLLNINQSQTFKDDLEISTLAIALFTRSEETVLTTENASKFKNNAKMFELNSSALISTYLGECYTRAGIKLLNLQTDYILKVGGQMILIAMLTIMISTSNGFFTSRLAAKVAYRIRKDIFTKVEGFSNAEIDTFTTSSLITRTTSDIQQVQNFLNMSSRMLVYAPILAIGGMLKILDSTRDLAWTIAVGIGAMLAIILTLLIVVMPRFLKLQKLIDKLNSILRQNLTGQLVIRAFNTQKHEETKFDQENQKYTRISLFVNRAMSLMNPLMSIVLNGVSLLIMWFGAKMINSGNLEVGSLMAVVQYSMQIIFAFLMISFMSIMIPRLDTSLKRIKEVLNTKNSIVEEATPINFPKNIKGKIEFRNVGFKYSGAEKEVLSNIDLKINTGEIVGFIGSTGSGKSTLINLIPRFYDSSSGQILIDETDIKKVSLKELRKKIGYIAQKAVLFSGTIKSNMLVGKQDASDQEIYKALEIAQIKDFVTSSADQLETPVSQGGVNFSGGQKQRLSIARALVKRPEIYILDDTFSALDYKTDANLRKALMEEVKENKSTILIVAQRVSSLKFADKIVVLDKGRIINVGTHKELLKKCSIYQEIAASQLTNGELENE